MNGVITSPPLVITTNSFVMMFRLIHPFLINIRNSEMLVLEIRGRMPANTAYFSKFLTDSIAPRCSFFSQTISNWPYYTMQSKERPKRIREIKITNSNNLHIVHHWMSVSKYIQHFLTHFCLYSFIPTLFNKSSHWVSMMLRHVLSKLTDYKYIPTLLQWMTKLGTDGFLE